MKILKWVVISSLALTTAACADTLAAPPESRAQGLASAPTWTPYPCERMHVKVDCPIFPSKDSKSAYGSG